MWYHKYSALGFLGRWLLLYQSGQEAELMNQADPPDAVIIAIIQLFTSLMNATGHEEARSLLEEASNGLNRNSDIVLVVFEIFEQHVQSLRFSRGADGLLDVAAACVEFMTAAVSILPGRIWPLLARSSFVNLDGAGSLLVAIVSTEATTGTFSFLETSMQLYASLLEDAISRTVSQAHPNRWKESKRTLPMTDLGAPSHLTTRLLLGLTQAFAEIYDSLASRQFKSMTYQASVVRTGLTKTFRSLLDYGYGIDDSENLATKLTSVVSMASPYILDFFRPDSPTDPNLGAILQVLTDGLQEHDALHQEIIFQAKVEEIGQTLWLCHDLVRGARLKRDVTFLERQLCQIFPVLIRLYGMHTRYQLSCVRVMSELVAIGSISESDSSSLLSFLGMGSSKSFLEILSTLDSPFPNTELFVAIWELLTALLSARQQWFAIYLLTGSSPKEEMKNAKSDTTPQTPAIRGKAFLTIALDELSHIQSLEVERAIAMLSFVCRAQENWSWATSSLQSHPDFFTGIVSYVGRLNVKQDTPSHCYQYKIAALIAELSVVYLHYARSNGDYSIIKKMLPAFKWYAATAVENTSYNRSLHANLRKNLTARYPQCDIMNFKKTAFFLPKYGEAYFYDVRIAAKMLSFDSSWMGTARSPGFAHEFTLANLNLSLVDSQLFLLRSFKALCIEHSAFFVRDREVQKLMAQIVRNCLIANAQSCPAERIFESLFEDRIELAIGLLQRLVDVKAKGSEFTTLLAAAWETTRFRNASYETAVSRNDLDYYRSCLTALLLCIQLHVGKHPKPQPSTPGQTSHT